MTDLVPRDTRIDRATLERVIRRATELQAREREFGEGLTEDELMQLGSEVGIPPMHLRQALIEERLGAVRRPERGLLPWLTGPRRVAAERSLGGTASHLEELLEHWFVEGELLQIKRRFPDRTTWEPKEGAFASLRRSLGLGGRRYLLAQAREVVSRVTQLDERHCHVQLVADVSNTRTEHLVGSSLVGAGGAASTGIALVAGVLAPVAVIPVVVAAPLAVLIARSRRPKVERVHVALEQVLDRLEHGEIRKNRAQPKAQAGLLDWIGDGIKKLDV